VHRHRCVFWTLYDRSTYVFTVGGIYVQESFLNSVVRVLFKTDPPGFFERSYPRLLEMNTWQSINQEILYVCPQCRVVHHTVCYLLSAVLCLLRFHSIARVFAKHRISTPRRFGKTISVCLFVAALVFACPMVEISIYSTCEFHTGDCPSLVAARAPLPVRLIL